MSRNFCFVSSVINKSFLTIVKDLSLYFEKKKLSLITYQNLDKIQSRLVAILILDLLEIDLLKPSNIHVLHKW